MNSRQVIFPNHSYQEKLLVMFKGNRIKMKLRNAIIIPNGVDGLWLNNPAIYLNQ